MSASSKPTVAPSAASAKAKLTDVVDLPTPPLPEATAMMFFTFGSRVTPCCALCATIRLPIFTVTSPTSGKAFSA